MARKTQTIAALMLAGSLFSTTPALAASKAGAGEPPLSTRSSFRIGDSGVLCTAQSKSTDERLKGLFDRAYLLTCRDAATSVGSVVALRRVVNLATEKSALQSGALSCAPIQASIEGLGRVEALRCRDTAAHLDYLRYAIKRGKNHYFAEGLAGYDPALKLALASVVLDAAQKGVVQVATTEVSDPAAFARVQAGALDAVDARNEAYSRGNGSRFAESSEFFETLADRDRNDPKALSEAIANHGLQQSNLGNFAAATRLLARAEAVAPQGDGVSQRLIRNYRAINALNQRDPEGALAELKRPVSEVTNSSDELRAGVIELSLAMLINRESTSAQELASISSGLTVRERAAVLDGQAIEARGIALRQAGKLDEAAAALDEAAAAVAKVREGQIRSTSWLQSEIAVERALVDELRGNRASAAAAFDRAITTIGSAFPESPALLSLKARKAAFLVRGNDATGARALFDEVIKESAGVADSGAALNGLLGPYFSLLSADGSASAAAAMFRASQVMQRPGVAQTQAILARQLSAGNDEASSIFRLAVARTREIVRSEGEISRLSALAKPTPAQMIQLAATKGSLEALRADQVRMQAKLADFPRYKALAPSNVELAELQSAMRDGESYYKMMVVEDSIYALFATKGGARALKLGAKAAEMSGEVAKIRHSIAHEEKGAIVTEPFDLARARALYLTLFGPVDADLRASRHLIFEPDGPMLELPPYLLPVDQAGVDAYQARIARAGDDYDFTGINWLGRGREVSISVSPRSFLDVRAIAPSRARETYLGLGRNAVAVARPAVAVADECDWPMQVWQNPISADELRLGERLFGAGKSRVVTDAAFNDTALLGDKALGDFRIVHFATHGLVTAPRAGCPARPALVTSFAPEGSDGLLSFREIFDLKLDADVVILSACDTAGSATVGASLDAGVATGGNYALDGLVRAFVGAGARSVVASHWPVPDDYDATKRLISGLLGAAPGQPIAQALAGAQRGLMDDAKTSHPFYWAAFIILGDGAKPLVTQNLAATAGGTEPGASRK